MTQKKQRRRWTIEPGHELTEMDKEILYWQNRSKSVPSRDLESIAEELKKGGHSQS